MAKIILPMSESEEGGSTNPIWIDLAHYLSGYVKCGLNCVVYRGEVPSFGPAAIIKVWAKTKDEDKLYLDPKAYSRQQQWTKAHNDVTLICTISLTQEIAFCASGEYGIKEIELAHPQACDGLIAWMVKVGLAPKKSKWKDHL